jgi:hypothetical protein
MESGTPADLAELDALCTHALTGLSYDTALRQLGITDKQVLLFVVYGSRLWQTYTKKSDFDCFIVITQECKLRTGTNNAGNNDYLIMNKVQYLEKCRQQRLIQLLPVLLPPHLRRHYVWKTTAALLRSITIDCKAVSHRAQVTWSKDQARISKFVSKGRLHKARQCVLGYFRSRLILQQLEQGAKYINPFVLGKQTDLALFCQYADSVEACLQYGHELLQLSPTTTTVQ